MLRVLLLEILELRKLVSKIHIARFLFYSAYTQVANSKNSYIKNFSAKDAYIKNFFLKILVVGILI